MEPTKYNHCVVGSNYHFQFTPGYRRDIYRDLELKNACKKVFYEIAERLGVTIEAIEFGPEHVHLFISNCKKYSVEELAMRFKGASSRVLRRDNWDNVRKKLWGKKLWSAGYFAESIGRITSESVIYYIERQQGKHWGDDYGVHELFETQQIEEDDNQTTLTIWQTN